MESVENTKQIANKRKAMYKEKLFKSNNQIYIQTKNVP